MIRAVLDTNVVISAHLGFEGPASLIFDLLFSRFFRGYVSEAFLSEYEQVLNRPRFGLARRDISKSMRLVRKATILVVPKINLQVTSDPDDNKVVVCALEARADYIVTGNIRHFPKRFQDIRTILPRQFLIILASEPG